MNYTKSVYAEKPWIQAYAPGVPAEIKLEEICLHEILSRSSENFPDQNALNFLGYTVTYKKLNDMVDRFATALDRFGIKKNDSVAIILPNTIQCVVAYFAILRLGAIAVMNNPLYSDKELLHQLKDSESKLLITIDLLANRMINLRPQTSVKQIIIASIGEYLPFPKSLLFPLVAKKKGLAAEVKAAEEIYRFKKTVNDTPPTPPEVKVSFSDIAQYQYTGGTTGVSKGVILTHRNLSANLQQVAAWFPHLKNGEEMMLGALPFFHVFGLTISMNYAIYMGWGNVLIPKPQPEQLFESFLKFKPTFIPMVPTMYIGMLNHPGIDKLDLTRIAGCFSGSASLPVEVIRKFEDKSGVVICEGFGMTESSPVTHINPLIKGRTKPGTIGLPLPNTDCRIVDITDGITDVPQGGSGQLIVRGPQVMRGYKGMDDETKNALRDGWLYTGDIAVMDEEGYFSIIDRLKDMVISGGYNVYPREIDEVLYQHPKVMEACSIGVPDPVWGESVKAFVVLRDGVTCTPEEIIEFCKEHMAKFKIPKEVEFRQSLPKSAVGKILRKELKSEELSKK